MSPMLGNLSAVAILSIGCAILFAIEKLMDRRRQTRYLPKPTHRGATYRISARKCP